MIKFFRKTSDGFKLSLVSLLFAFIAFMAWTARDYGFAAPISGSRASTYVIPLDITAERAGHTRTGVTVSHSGSRTTINSGVSLLADIDLTKLNLIEYEFAFAPGTIYTSAVPSADGVGKGWNAADVYTGTANTAHTSGASTTYRYAFSPIDRSVTDWERMGITGTSELCTVDAASANSPYPFNISSPELGGHLAIFIDTSSASSWCLPGFIPDGSSPSGGQSCYVIAR